MRRLFNMRRYAKTGRIRNHRWRQRQTLPVPAGWRSAGRRYACQFSVHYLPPGNRNITYDNTVDEDFIIDTLPGRPDTLLITGLSGHGFKFAPVLGEIASQFAQGEASSFNLAPFSLARFNA